MFAALKSQKVSLQILLPVIGFLPFLSVIIWPANELPIVHNAQGQLYFAYRELLQNSPVYLVIISYVFVSLIASYLFWVNIRFEILGQRTVLLSYVFFLVVCTPLHNLYAHPGLLSGFLVFLSLISIFSIYHQSRHPLKIFNAGLFFGLAFLCYPPFVVLFPILLLALARIKQFNFRDLLIILLGFIVVMWIYGIWLWLDGSLAYEWVSIKQWFKIRTTWPVAIPGNKTLNLIWIAWVLTLLPISFSVARSRKDVGRRILSVLVQLIWAVPIIILVFERVSFEIWALLSIPISVLFSLAIMNLRRRWLPNLLFISLLGFMLVFQLIRIL